MNADVILECCDTLDWCRRQPDNSVDLVFTSPPYEAQRTYGMDFKLSGQAWVDWAVERFLEHYGICRGLTCWVVAGSTRDFRWSATPALLMADLHRAGVRLRDPRIYHRVGIPGSGGPDDWRHDYEWIIVASKGRLPWADPTATGKPPKYGPGGEISHRLRDGRRANGKAAKRGYSPPKLANPGNVIRCKVGGGLIGSDLAHENEAPFPESLVEPFIRCFCPPDGIVYDAFCGSGTTAAVAIKTGRRFVGTDIRQSQIELAGRRIREARQVSKELFA